MTEREKIFGRIREALINKAPRPGAHDLNASAPAIAAATAPQRPAPGTARRWLPPTGQTFEEQVERFRAASAELKTNFVLLAAASELRAVLLELRAAENWQRVATHRAELTLAAAEILDLPTLFTDEGYDVAEMERCDVAITGCDVLIAQTGSVLVTNRSAGGRALSVLPAHHVVLARRQQLVPDLTAGLAWVQNMYRTNYPSMISIISGPSRTGDIERILVLGAHGPKKLTVVCV